MHHPYFMTPDTDVIVYGHTHVQHSQHSGKSVYINPGELCARDDKYSTVSLLEIKKDIYRIYDFRRQIKTQEWREFVTEYPRKGGK
jgi:predicted phosphodiesterase